MKKNVFYAQSGGVTAVINASACGVIETARKHKDKLGRVYAGRNGILGALTEDMIDTTAESAKTIAGLRYTPGGAFGSARYKLKGLDQNRAEYERLIEVFKAHDIGYFFYNGGNDSMDTAYKVSQIGEAMGYPVVAKLVSSRVTHKSDLGGVLLNLDDADAVRSAFQSLQGSARTHEVQDGGAHGRVIVPSQVQRERRSAGEPSGQRTPGDGDVDLARTR